MFFTSINSSQKDISTIIVLEYSEWLDLAIELVPRSTFKKLSLQPIDNLNVRHIIVLVIVITYTYLFLSVRLI